MNEMEDWERLSNLGDKIDRLNKNIENQDIKIEKINNRLNTIEENIKEFVHIIPKKIEIKYKMNKIGFSRKILSYIAKRPLWR